MNNISSYLYVPEKDVTYCRLSVYKNNAKHENLLLDYNSNQSIEYKKIKDQYGDLLEFTITKIEYKHYFFPLWDYGYPHNIKIIVLARYANIKTEEIIEAYYLVNKKQTQIVHYMIIEK